jgi:hypothetical protein
MVEIVKDLVLHSLNIRRTIAFLICTIFQYPYPVQRKQSPFVACRERKKERERARVSESERERER